MQASAIEKFRFFMNDVVKHASIVKGMTGGPIKYRVILNNDAAYLVEFTATYVNDQSPDGGAPLVNVYTGMNELPLLARIDLGMLSRFLDASARNKAKKLKTHTEQQNSAHQRIMDAIRQDKEKKKQILHTRPKYKISYNIPGNFMDVSRNILKTMKQWGEIVNYHRVDGKNMYIVESAATNSAKAFYYVRPVAMHIDWNGVMGKELFFKVHLVDEKNGKFWSTKSMPRFFRNVK